jgi:serine/threonine protein kinase
MASLFEQADFECNPSDFFWKNVDESAFQDCDQKTLKSGVINFFDSSGKNKKKTLHLTPGKLYLKKKSSPNQVVDLYWKRLEAFSEENDEDKRFGFRLTQRGIFQDFYLTSSKDLESWLDALSPFVLLSDLEEDFTIIKEIGRGNYAKVFLAHESDSQQEFAVKSISKQAILASSRSTSALISEIKIMRELTHPFLIKLHKVYETSESVHLILDYMRGGDLFQRIQMKNSYSEENSAFFMRNLLQAVDFIHSNHYVHRDLKPENILMESWENDFLFKIADFGLAAECKEDCVQRCGSPGYVAPEILKKRNYGKKCDIFSAGVILYVLLSGRAPFAGKTTNEILIRNKECKIYFQDKYWKHVSREGIDCVLRLTEPDPENRPSAKHALKHPWLTLAFPEKSRNIEPVKSPQEKNAGISAELMKRMNKMRGNHHGFSGQVEGFKAVNEEQRRNINQNAKNLLLKLRNADTAIKG